MSLSSSSYQFDHKKVDPEAFRIIKTLQRKGFIAYLVGGCVRDLLLGLHPKDFDISTTAHPHQIKKIIPQSYIIGRRFRLVLVKRAAQQFEVSTFRRNASQKELIDFNREKEEAEEFSEKKEEKSSFLGRQALFLDKHRKHRKDNLFGSPEDDAKRRDFTINGLFYDPISYKLIDYVDGLRDLQQGVIRMIGEPEERLKEDPIRTLRAIRLSHKLHFTIDLPLKEAMKRHASRLKDSALPRRREELLKFLRLEDPSKPFLESFDLKILPFLSPHMQEILSHSKTSDSFLNDLSSYHDKHINLELPLELFSALILSYIKNTPLFSYNSFSLKAFPQEVQENLLNFMKNELGMFKYEQDLVLKSLRLKRLLHHRFRLEKKPKKMKALIKESVFPLALKLAERHHSLSAEDLYFWKKNGKTFKKTVPSSSLSQEKKKREK